MKRSRQLRLLLLGTAPLALVACSSEPKEQDLTYETLDDCMADGKATAVACSTAFREAEQIHVRQSPHYNDESSCAQGYGSCTRYTQNGSSFWMPAMVGFLAGRWTSGIGSNQGPYIDTRGSYGYRPLYRTDDDRNRGTWSSSSSGGGSYSARTNSRSWGSSSGSGSSGRISTSSVSRGGFGGSSSSRGGWGGG